MIAKLGFTFLILSMILVAATVVYAIVTGDKDPHPPLALFIGIIGLLIGGCLLGIELLTDIWGC